MIYKFFVDGMYLGDLNTPEKLTPQERRTVLLDYAERSGISHEGISLSW